MEPLRPCTELQKIDLRAQYAFFEYKVRTSDNVELLLDLVERSGAGLARCSLNRGSRAPGFLDVDGGWNRAARKRGAKQMQSRHKLTMRQHHFARRRRRVLCARRSMHNSLT